MPGVTLEAGRSDSTQNAVYLPRLEGREEEVKVYHLTTSDEDSVSEKRTKSQARQKMVPLRFVAGLVDGAGKSWLAGRRLWGVRELSPQLLAEAGLGLGDIDLEQEVSMRLKGYTFAKSRFRSDLAETIFAHGNEQSYRHSSPSDSMTKYVM